MDHKRKRKRSDESIVSDNLSNIHPKVTKFSIVGTIENFSQRPEKIGEVIMTSTCVVGGIDVSEWCLLMYPNGQKEDLKEYVSVYLGLFEPEKAKIKFGFSVLNNKGEELNVRTVNRVIDIDNNRQYGFLDFVRRDFLLNESNGLLVNDKLTILCQVEIIELKRKKHGTEETPLNVIVLQPKISSDYGNLFDSQLLTDCIIKIEDTEIRVHKAVLAARSSTFRNIFNSTSGNSQMNVIEIKNFRAEVVKKMLEYIYKDEISNVRNMASEMLAIAVEYGLDGLKEIAVVYLYVDLTIENVWERLILSEKFSSEVLKERCEKFITDNAENLRKTKNCEEIFKNHPSLAEGLFWKLVDLFSTSNNSSPEVR
uniref:BTB domain-containing protein n=1 Tax=Strongyloides papillosus TaxID=174720 RepID=A0A0N5BM39_STREA